MTTIEPGMLVRLRPRLESITLHATDRMLINEEAGALEQEDVGSALAVRTSPLRLLVVNSRCELGWAWKIQLKAVT